MLTCLRSLVSVTWPSRAVAQRGVVDDGRYVAVTYADELTVNASTQLLHC